MLTKHATGWPCQRNRHVAKPYCDASPVAPTERNAHTDGVDWSPVTRLGWDVSDPNLVTPEYDAGKGKADYTLINRSETILVTIVEAKRLNHPLNDQEFMQMLNYANAEGVKYAAVTDGNVWELYDVFKPARLEDRCLLSLKMVNTPAYKLALGLLLLWRPSLALGAPVTAQEPALGTRPEPTPTESFINVDTPLAPPRSACVTLPASSPPVETGWVKLSDCNPPTNTDAPENIRFPNGTEKPIKKWRDLLVVTGEWLNTTGKLALAPKPILSGPKEKVLDTDHSGFIATSSITGTKFWLNTHGSADNMRRKTKAILSRCGVSPDRILLCFADSQIP